MDNRQLQNIGDFLSPNQKSAMKQSAPNIILRNHGQIMMMMLGLTYFIHSSTLTECKSSMTRQTWPKVDRPRKLILTSSSSGSSRSGWNWKAAPEWLWLFVLASPVNLQNLKPWWFLGIQQHRIHTKPNKNELRVPLNLSQVPFLVLFFLTAKLDGVVSPSFLPKFWTCWSLSVCS